jgi:UDP-N-acetylmuramate dehydrogenase
MEFLENVALAPYTTFGIGGPARWFSQALNEADVVEGVKFAHEQDLPLFILGGGSNLLVSDAGFPGVVLHIRLRGTREYFEGDKLILGASAGEDWDNFVTLAVSLNCAGIECLAGIPGTVGGTPVQNVGAYGQEISQTVRMVRAFDLQLGEFVEFSASECDFAYRQSIFNSSEKGRYVVTWVEYALIPGGEPTLAYADLRQRFQEGSEPPSLIQVAETVREIRRSKGMFLVQGDPDCASAGSFFKNPVVDRATLDVIAAEVAPGTRIPQYPAADGQIKLAAAWLVEKAGFAKGYAKGPAGISTRHTLALVNRGGATAADILAISQEITERVEGKFGIWLEREPVWVE